MKDEEVIKALECCKSFKFNSCGECPYLTLKDDIFTCIKVKQNDTIDLIKRLKADNKNLQKRNKTMNKRKATIYDYVRMCESCMSCSACPIHSLKKGHQNCSSTIVNNYDKVNEIILKWCDEHPKKTRQSEFLKIFPSAELCDVGGDQVINIKPCHINFSVFMTCTGIQCEECKKKYWLEERRI